MSAALPLKVSPNGRYLVDQNGVPTLLAFNSGASLANTVGITTADMDQYIADLVARGYNGFWLTPIVNGVTTGTGQAPFIGGDFSQPNTVFFDYIDVIIGKAAAAGLVVILHVAWAGFAGNPEDWSGQLDTQPIARLRAYGRFLGLRYKTTDNLIFALWGDRTPNGSNYEPYDQIAQGIIETDTIKPKLITAEMQRQTTPAQSSGVGPGRQWLKLDWGYSVPDQRLYQQIRTQYQAARRMPIFGGEYYYEGEHSVTQQTLRASAYWCILQGGCGYMFGNGTVWQFATGWQAALSSQGSVEAARAFAFFNTYPWYNLKPDDSHAFVTAGFGTDGATDYAVAARTIDGTLGMVYIPTARAVTVAGAKMAGTFRARWFDPTNGTFTADAGSPYPNSGSRVCNPPNAGGNAGGNGDWVLVCEYP